MGSARKREAHPDFSGTGGVAGFNLRPSGQWLLGVIALWPRGQSRHICVMRNHDLLWAWRMIFLSAVLAFAVLPGVTALTPPARETAFHQAVVALVSDR